MSSANVSTAAEEILRSFDLLPKEEKHLIACEIMRKVFPATPDVNDAQLATLYAEFFEADRKLAEEGIEDYEQGLMSEDVNDNQAR
jgi:hypothetical protein